MFGFGKKVFTQVEATQLLRCAGKFGVLSDKGFFSNTGDLYDRFKHNVPKLVGSQDLKKVDADLWRNVIGAYACLEGIMAVYALNKAHDKDDAIQALAFAKESKTCAEMLLNKMKTCIPTRFGSYDDIRSEEMKKLEMASRDSFNSRIEKVREAYASAKTTTAAEQKGHSYKDKEYEGLYKDFLNAIRDAYDILIDCKHYVGEGVEGICSRSEYYQLLETVLDENYEDISADQFTNLCNASYKIYNQFNKAQYRDPVYKLCFSLEKIRLAEFRNRFANTPLEKYQLDHNYTIPIESYKVFVGELNGKDQIDYFNHCSDAIFNDLVSFSMVSGSYTGDENYDALSDQLIKKGYVHKAVYDISKAFAENVCNDLGVAWNDEDKETFHAYAFAGAIDALFPWYYSKPKRYYMERECAEGGINDSVFLQKALYYYDSFEEIKKSATTFLPSNSAKYNIACSLHRIILCDQMHIDRDNELMKNLYRDFCFEMLAFGKMHATILKKREKGAILRTVESLHAIETQFVDYLMANCNGSEIDKGSMLLSVIATTKLAGELSRYPKSSWLLDLLHCDGDGVSFVDVCRQEANIAEKYYEIYGVINGFNWKDDSDLPDSFQKFCDCLSITKDESIKGKYSDFIDSMRLGLKNTSI